MVDGILKVGTTTYYLKFDMNVFCNLYAEGIDVMRFNDSMFNVVNFRLMLFHGLQSVHSKEVTTVEVAGDIMSKYLEENTFDELSNVLVGTMVKAFGKRTNNSVEGK